MNRTGKSVKSVKTINTGSRSQGDSTVVTVRISGKEVQVGCTQGEEDQVIKAANIVDQIMAELRQRNASSTTEKVAILTAINFAHELNKINQRSEISDDARERLAAVNAQLSELLE